MFDVFFKKAHELNSKGVPFAMAVVVRREAPISGRPADKAIIQEDGSIFGWIGGGCTQPVIAAEARQALRDGKPRLVRITRESRGAARDGVIEYEMSCHGGGALDIFIEPIMPKPQLIILGKSVVARTLARLGSALNYRVVAAAPGADLELFPEADAVQDFMQLDPEIMTRQTYMIVSTQGEGDEEAIEQAVMHDLPYASFVASRKKADEVFRRLRDTGIPEDRLNRIKVPAGLDIRAHTPEEIAVSILAEIIQVMRSGNPMAEKKTAAEASSSQRREALKIENMTCRHCVATVQSALESIAGVTVDEVQVGSALIRYDPSQVERPRIVEALAERGYPVVAESAAGADQPANRAETT